MFGKLVPVPSGAVIPERDIGKRPILNCINLGVTFAHVLERGVGKQS